MDQSRVSGVVPISDRSRSLRKLIDRNRLDGIAIVLFGITQVLLGLSGLVELSWSGLTESSWTIFVLGGGGWLLIGIGVTVFQGRVAFESGGRWGIESERLAWLSTVVTLAIAIGAAAGAVWVLFV